MENTKTFANRQGLDLFLYRYGEEITEDTEALAYIDYANSVAFELTSDIVWATGGRGFKKRVGFKNPYEGTLTIETQIRNGVLLDILTGGDGTAAGGAYTFKDVDDTNNYFVIKGHTVCKSEDGSIVYEEITAHKAMVSPGFSATYTGDGDPQSVSIEFQLAADADDNVLTLYQSDKDTRPVEPVTAVKEVRDLLAKTGAVETTIKLGDSLEVEEQLVLDNPSAHVTLDLNGKELTGSLEGKSLFKVLQGSLTVTGGGTMKNDKHYVFNVGSATDEALEEPDTSAALTIEDGIFEGNCTAVQVIGGTVEILDGDFSIVEETNHDYKYVLNCIDRFYKNGKAKIEVKGGTFHKFNPSDCGAEGANTNFVAAGYTVDENLETYTVRAE